jgi:hypothetical protein
MNLSIDLSQKWPKQAFWTAIKRLKALNVQKAGQPLKSNGFESG